MKLVDMTVTAYMDLMASDAPAPGGGSASALCGAQGASLAAMVAGLTIGKKKYPDDQELCQKAAQEGMALKQALLDQVDRDTEAFNLVSAAFKLPKETDEDKVARSKAIADATLVATQVPFETMQITAKALELAASLVGHSNRSAASDLGVASLNLLSCMKGAWLNVLINLGGVKDEEKAAAFRAQGEAMVKQAEETAAAIYNAIIETL